MISTVVGRVLHAGIASGRSVVLGEPLSFWGGFDPVTGEVIDRAHPQVGAKLSERVLVMPGSRGSAGTPGVVAEAIRRGTAPSAFIVTKPDINLTAGAMIAAALCSIACPVVLVDTAGLGEFVDGAGVEVGEAGSITITTT